MSKELDLAALKAVAEAATQDDTGSYNCIQQKFEDTFDPPTVLALITRIEWLEKYTSKVEAAERGDWARD